MSKNYEVLNELVPKTQELHRAIFDKGYEQGKRDVLCEIRADIEQIEIKGHIRDVECFRAGIDVVLNVIDKYNTGSCIHCNCTDEGIAKSFIDDVEAVKDLLPR